MRAVLVRERNAPVVVEDISIDDPRPNEVVVRVVAGGLCHSDLGAIDGKVDMFPLPIVLGHESAGVVERVGSAVNYVVPGDHVVMTLGSFCGHCEFCLTGRSYLCAREGIYRAPGDTPRLSSNGQALTPYAGLGSLAEYGLVHENSVAKVPHDMPLDAASLLGCGITTGLGAALNTARVHEGSTVAVIGCGGVGLSTIQGARLANAERIIAIDPSSSRLEFATMMGATDLVNPADGDAVEQVRSLLGAGVDYAFEVVGHKKTAEQAFSMLRRGGLAVIVGVIFNTSIELDGNQIMSACRLTGCPGGSGNFRLDVPRYARYYQQGRLLLDELITRRIGIDQINEGLDDLRNVQGARTVMVFDPA